MRRKESLVIGRSSLGLLAACGIERGPVGGRHWGNVLCGRIGVIGGRFRKSCVLRVIVVDVQKMAHTDSR
jgi:hypothetical protein